MKKITVIGGGGTGIMMATNLTMKGHDVTLFEMYEHAKKILEIKERGYVEVVGNAINGKAVITENYHRYFQGNGERRIYSGQCDCTETGRTHKFNDTIFTRWSGSMFFRWKLCFYYSEK